MGRAPGGSDQVVVVKCLKRNKCFTVQLSSCYDFRPFGGLHN